MIDPNEAPEGYLAMEGEMCFGCEVPFLSGVCLRSRCGKETRKDGCNVIFVKKHDDGRATANFPCDDMGTPV